MLGPGGPGVVLTDGRLVELQPAEPGVLDEHGVAERSDRLGRVTSALQETVRLSAGRFDESLALPALCELVE